MFCIIDNWFCFRGLEGGGGKPGPESVYISGLTMTAATVSCVLP